jgi:hypothetical protein
VTAEEPTPTMAVPQVGTPSLLLLLAALVTVIIFVAVLVGVALEIATCIMHVPIRWGQTSTCGLMLPVHTQPLLSAKHIKLY